MKCSLGISNFQTMKFLHLVLCPWVCFGTYQNIVYGNLNRICILLLCENCTNLNYVELVHSAFQVYCNLLLFCSVLLCMKRSYERVLDVLAPQAARMKHCRLRGLSSRHLCPHSLRLEA